MKSSAEATSIVRAGATVALILVCGAHGALAQGSVEDYFLPFDLPKAGVNLNGDDFEPPDVVPSLAEARNAARRHPDDPRVLRQLLDALSEERSPESQRDIQERTVQLYEKEASGQTLPPQDIVDWTRTLQSLGRYQEGLRVSEDALTGECENDVPIIRHLAVGSVLWAPFVLTGLEDHGGSIPHNLDGVMQILDRFDSRDATPAQRAKARDYALRGRRYIEAAVKCENAGAADFFQRAWFDTYSRGILAFIDGIEFDIDALALWKSPYLQRAWEAAIENPKIQARRVLIDLLLTEALEGKKIGAEAERRIRALLNETKNPPAELYDALAYVQVFREDYLGAEEAQPAAIEALSRDPAIQNSAAIRLQHLIDRRKWRQASRTAYAKAVVDRLGWSFALAASLQIQTGHLRDARKTLEMAREHLVSASDGIAIEIVEATLALKSGDTTVGIERMESLLERESPPHPVVAFNLGLALYRADQPERALELLKVARENKAPKQPYTDDLKAAAVRISMRILVNARSRR